MPGKIEMRKMQVLLKESINEGAAGLSTGLIYPPGIYSDTEELIELCRCLNSSLVTHHSSLIYTSHMRSEGKGLIESIKEISRIAKEANIKVHISHIKTSGKENWDKIDEAIALIEDARRKGIRITCDRYPYTASSTDLDTILPSWTYEGGAEEELRRLKSPSVLEKIKKRYCMGIRIMIIGQRSVCLPYHRKKINGWKAKPCLIFQEKLIKVRLMLFLRF